MLRKTLLISALMGLALFSVGCGQSLSWKAVDAQIRSRFPGVPQLPTDSLAAMLAQRRGIVLLDARTEEEYWVSHLPGARRIDPSASFAEGVPTDATVVVYCSVGYRSSALAERLMAAGFKDVRNLEGSIFRWANEGHPVVREGEAVQEVHPYDRVWGNLLRRDLRAYAPRKGDS